MRKIAVFPKDFQPHKLLKNVYTDRVNSLEKDSGFDFATAEQLAYATLLEEGKLNQLNQRLWRATQRPRRGKRDVLPQTRRPARPSGRQAKFHPAAQHYVAGRYREEKSNFLCLTLS